MKPLAQSALRQFSYRRIWTPTGFISPVDVAFASRLDWRGALEHFDPNAYTPEQWRHLMRLAARAWLEQDCWLPATLMLQYQDLARLQDGGDAPQTFTNKDIFTTPVTGQGYTVGAASVLLLKLWGGGAGSGASSSSTPGTSGRGGGAGFVSDQINVLPGQGLLLDVAGGGKGGVTTTTAGNAGGGGGYSAVRDGATIKSLSPGGGAGAGGTNGSAASGAGGWAFTDGTSIAGAGGGRGGKAATGSAGGAGGTGGTGVDGGAGGSLQGGTGGSSGTQQTAAAGGLNGGGAGGRSSSGNYGPGGGGGGGGLYGGGGGEAGAGNGWGAGGGGAGSPFITNGTSEGGLNATPGGSTDPDWNTTAGVAGGQRGGASLPGFDGGAGQIVIIW